MKKNKKFDKEMNALLFKLYEYAIYWQDREGPANEWEGDFKLYAGEDMKDIDEEERLEYWANELARDIRKGNLYNLKITLFKIRPDQEHLDSLKTLKAEKENFGKAETETYIGYYVDTPEQYEEEAIKAVKTYWRKQDKEEKEAREKLIAAASENPELDNMLYYIYPRATSVLSRYEEGDEELLAEDLREDLHNNWNRIKDDPDYDRLNSNWTAYRNLREAIKKHEEDTAKKIFDDECFDTEFHDFLKENYSYVLDRSPLLIDHVDSKEEYVEKAMEKVHEYWKGKEEK